MHWYNSKVRKWQKFAKDRAEGRAKWEREGKKRVARDVEERHNRCERVLREENDNS